MSFKVKVSDKINNLAKSGSKGKFALHVRQAVQEAKEIKVEPTGIASAKDYGPWLTKNGYKSTNKSYSEASVGSIAVLDSSDKHKDGHIQVLNNENTWVSDFKQKSFFPYGDGSKPNYVIYE